ncbi:MAG: serine/threonine protein kinase, partial [Deltaproteobacteria bacterium]
MLKLENSNGEKLGRYRNEMTFHQKYHHPNILQILDGGFIEISDVKCPFYVMPFYKETFRDIMNKGLGGDSLLDYFGQIIGGLEYAH